MRKIYFLIVIILLSIGCKNETNTIDKIEFASWDIRRFYNDNNNVFKCRYFASIIKDGDCQIVVEPYSQVPQLEYYKIDKSLIVFRKIVFDIGKASLSLGTQLDLRPKPPALYNGQNLIMQIKKGNIKRVINFWQGEQGSKVYERLYSLIDSLYKSNTLSKIGDTISLFNKRQEFIKKIIKPDSLLNRLPPPPQKDYHDFN
jgi:hypothetical protein